MQKKNSEPPKGVSTISTDPVPEWFTHSFARREAIFLTKRIMALNDGTPRGGERITDLLISRVKYYRQIKAETSYGEEDNIVFLVVSFPDSTSIRITIPFGNGQAQGIFISTAYHKDGKVFPIPEMTQ